MQSLTQNMGALRRAAMDHPHGSTGSKEVPTQAQIGVLFAVWHHGLISIKELAQRFNMTSSAATQLVNGLVKEELLTRTEDKQDRRKIGVSLTAKGKTSLEEQKKKRCQMMEKVLSPLSDKELAQLQTISEKISENLKILWTKNHQQ
jgi:DNA-binding MarR family transcriptional regulator